MIDINELRKVIADCYWPTSPVAINELLDRLEAAESALSNLGVTPDEARDGLARHKALMARLEAAEKERDNANAAAIGVALQAEALRAKLEAAEKETVSWKGLAKQFGNEADALRAKIAEMGRQEPVALVKWQIGGPVVHIIGDVKPGDILYAIPGAQTQGEAK